MFRRMITMILLATVLVAACAPAVTPVPVAPTVAPVEPTEVSSEAAPEPTELLMWSEWCGRLPPDDCTGWGDLYCDGTITKPGDLGERYVAEWHKLHPEYQHVNVKCILASHPGGRIGPELLAMVRAGQSPHIYALYGGRTWLHAEIGIELDKYLSDEAKADYLDYDEWTNQDGTLTLLPGYGVFEFPVANKQLIERACGQEGFGCAPPEPWTIMTRGEYLEIAEAIRALDDGSYIGILWGIGTSGQNLNWHYFAQAGIPPFKDGEFTGLEGGEDMLSELLRFFDEGYLYPDVAGISDDDAFPIWGRGQIGVMMSGLRWNSFRDNAVAAGETEHWDIIPLLGVEWQEGVDPLIAGCQYSGAGFVADNTPEEYREAAASFMAYVLSQPFRGSGAIGDGLFPMQSQLDRELIVPGSRDEAFAYMAKTGFAQDGVRDVAYNEIREAFGQMLTSVFLHQATPEEGLTQFRDVIGEIVGE